MELLLFHCGFMTTSRVAHFFIIPTRDHSFSDDLSGLGLMKRISFIGAVAVLAATPALAADMVVKKAPPPPRAPAWSWTGFYVGVNVGGGFAKTDWFEDVSGSGGGGPPGFQDASVRASGVLGGGQIGFDWQNGWAVFGIQADADAAGIRGGESCFPQVIGIPQSCTTKIDAMGTVTGRFGAAFDRTLVYILGGFAWEHERLNNPGFIPGLVSFNPEFSGTRPGARVGAGIERALVGNWSAFVQYNFMGFGRRALVFTETNPAAVALTSPQFTEIIREDVHVIKAGINYRFNCGPGR
jgi:outer membrane immunogenic protein